MVAYICIFIASFDHIQHILPLHGIPYLELSPSITGRTQILSSPLVIKWCALTMVIHDFLHSHRYSHMICFLSFWFLFISYHSDVTHFWQWTFLHLPRTAFSLLWFVIFCWDFIACHYILPSSGIAYLIPPSLPFNLFISPGLPSSITCKWASPFIFLAQLLFPLLQLLCLLMSFIVSLLTSVPSVSSDGLRIPPPFYFSSHFHATCFDSQCLFTFRFIVNFRWYYVTFSILILARLLIVFYIRWS